MEKFGKKNVHSKLDIQVSNKNNNNNKNPLNNTLR